MSKESTTDSNNQASADGKNSHAKLEEELDKLQSIIDSINGIFWEVDAQTLLCTYVSAQVENILGYSTSDWLNDKDFWANHIHPEDKDEVVNYSRQSTSQLKDHSYEYRMIAKNGSEVWLDEKVSVVTEGGKAISLRGVTIDITERKMAEAQLVESQVINQLINENSRDGIMFSDLSGNIYSVNPKACQIFGRTEEEMLKLGRNDLIEITDPRLAKMLNNRDDEGFSRGELIGIRKDGSNIHLLVSSQVFKNKDGQPRVSLVISDISEEIVSGKINESKSKITDLITTGDSLASLLKSFVLEIEANNNEVLCSIFLLDEAGKSLSLCSAPSFPDFYNQAVDRIDVGPNVGSCGSAAYSGEVVIAEDIQTHPNWGNYKEVAGRANLKSSWSQPIKGTDEKVLGVFAMYHQQIKKPSSSDFTLIEEYANMAAIAIEKYNVLVSKENTIKRNEKLYNSTPIMMHTIDAKGKLISVSDYWLEKMEYSREEVIGKSVTNFLTAESQKYVLTKVFPIYFKFGTVNNIELQFIAKSGKVLDTLLSDMISKDKAGNLDKVRAVITDITDRRVVEETTKRLEEFYNSTPTIMHSINSEGKLVSVSDHWLEKMEYSREEVIGKLSIDFLTVDSQRYAKEILPKFYKDGWMNNVEYQFVTKSGKILDMLMSAISANSRSGNFLHSVAVLTDITEKNKVIRNLSNSQIRINQFFQNIRHSIVFIDKNYEITDFNDLSNELNININGKGINVGDDMLQYISPSNKKIFTSNLKKCFSGENLSFDLEIPITKNKLIWHNINLQSITKSQEIVGVAISTLKIDAEKRNAQRIISLTDNIPESSIFEYRTNDDATDHNFNYISHGAQNLFGSSADNMMNDVGLMFRIIHPDYLDIFNDAIARSKKSLIDLNLEYKIRTSNGIEKWVNTRAKTTLSIDGMFLFEGITINITHQKELELKQVESENLLQNILDNMISGVVVVSKNGTINYANKWASKILDFKFNETEGILYNSNKWINIDTDGLPMSNNRLPISLAIQERKHIEKMVYGIVTSKGETKWLSVNANPLFDMNNNVTGAVASFQDITESRELVASVRKNSEQLSYASKLAKIGEWELNLVNMSIKWSDQVCDIHGVESGYIPSFEEAINFYTEDSRPIISHAFEQCIETGEYFDVTLQIVTSSEQIKWVRAIGVSERIHNRTVKAYGIFQDIDDLKKKEVELEKLALIAKNTDNMVVVTDANRKVQWVNQAFINTTGYQLEEVKGKSPGVMLKGPETDMAIMDEVREKLLRNESVNFEIVNYTKQGEKYWSDIGIQPVFKDTGDLDYFIAIQANITERKIKDELIKKSVSNLRSIFENTDKAFVLYNHKFEVQSFNSLARVFVEDVQQSKIKVGVNGINAFPTSRRKIVTKYFNDALIGNSSQYEVSYGNDIEERWFNTRFFPVNVDGKTTGVVMAVNDSTKEKMAERLLSDNYKELLQINQDKETLLKEIHHRVKNNLQLISSIIYIRMTGMSDSVTKNFLGETRQKINSIALIHETLLQQTESTREVSIDNYLSKLMSDMQVAYTSDYSNVDLSIDIDPIMVSIDVAINCSMIVTELFTNSIKHSGDKDISNYYISLNIKKKDDIIEFVMSDSGPGIPTNIRPGEHNSFGMKLLDVFFKQLDAEVIIEGTNGTTYKLFFKA